MRERLLAEGLGTFCLVLLGPGAIVINDASAGAVTHLGVAAVFGLVVGVLILALGGVSGAHFNPAVTVVFWRAGRMRGCEVMPYVLAQLGGAALAGAALRLLFPGHATLGATLPAGPAWQSFTLEVLLALILMLVILRVAHGAVERGLAAAAAIGGTVGLAALCAGPISGASMNPARSFGPALAALHFEHLWIYWTAPVLGALAALPLCRALQPRGDCCRRACA